MATPVEVSLWVSPYRSTPATASSNGAEPGSAVATDGSPMWGALRAAVVNLELNSPKFRWWLRSEIRLKVAASQKAVVPPLPSSTS